MAKMETLFSGGARMVHAEAVDMTLASLRAYWDRHQHVAVAWSGGKDSTAVLTLIVHLIEAGTYPDKWDGTEPTADTWLDPVFPDGTTQLLLFRDFVGRRA